MAVLVAISLLVPSVAAADRPPVDDDLRGYVTTPDDVGAFLDDLGALADWGYAEEVRSTVAATVEGLARAEATEAAVRAALADATRRASIPIPAPVPSSAPRATSGGACTGFAIPDYIIQRESRGDPSASNPSGAYGCAQTLLAHYNAGGACAGLNPYAVDGQRECVRILSKNGTDLAPWAETR